ncbi:MAG: flagellar basal-body rod protein FlgF [Deltaproteobacteria bacterium]|nr:MAG: flagellar basal-body rod protein FlgF [Deltaproteobacteria bacterium]RLB06370.1 MAG: flagellar basal-body rod protein FlgF [Deltaproteobacteria bacterium]
MRIGYYEAALGSMQQLIREDVNANNLANAGTIGFKKTRIEFTDFLAMRSKTDLKAGPVHKTGSPLDLAIVGKGFFAVETPDGTLYTRAGNFSIDSEGTLVNSDGYPVLSSGGNVILPNQYVSIQPDGKIIDGKRVLGELQIVYFEKPEELVPVGGTYFKNDPDTNPSMTAEDFEILQGSIEESNVNIVSEIVQLIDTLRTFEAQQHSLKFFDQMNANVIEKTV